MAERAGAAAEAISLEKGDGLPLLVPELCEVGLLCEKPRKQCQFVQGGA